MEFPSFNHHHHHNNRYGPPPPPPPNNFSDDRPNPYPNHHHLLPSLHLPPPPPLSYHSLPLPPPPPLPVPPPPPSYNPHQSHFTFLDAQNPSFVNHGHSSPSQSRFSNQSHLYDYRTDCWSDPHRVPPELPQRNPNLPEDNYRRSYSSNPRSENHYKPHVSERVIPSSRFRDETTIDGYANRDISNIVSQEQQVFRGSPNNDDHHGRVIDHYASARPDMNMDKSTGSSSRNMEDFVEKYEPRYITNSENERMWDRHGEDPRRVHQMKGKKNESGHNDGALFLNGREQSRDYEYESSRLTRVREGREEFKQVQKKSVLLRIGKPNSTHRNKSHDQHFSKTYLAESNNSSSFRGKDKDRDHTSKDSSLYSDHRMERDREHSPVELDVSFKSNALVAKAVATPSSPVVDNNNTQPRNRKIKRSSEFGSPLTKSGSSSNGLDCPSSSEKVTKQQKVKDSGNGGEPVLQQSSGTGGTVGPLSFRLKKKRKLKNFKNSPGASIFQLAEKDDKSAKVENKKSPSAVSIQAAIPSPLEEPIVSKAEELPQAMVLEKDSSEVENPNLHAINSDDPAENTALTAPMVSKVNDGLVNDLSQQSTQHEVSLNLVNDTQQVSTNANVSPDDTHISTSSRQDQIEIQKCSTESFSSFDACSEEIITMSPENSHNVSAKTQEMSTTGDMSSSDPSSDEIITVVPKNVNTLGFLDDVLPRKEDEILLPEGTNFSEDGSNKTPKVVVIVKETAILSSGKSYTPVPKMKDSEIQFNVTTPGEKDENVVSPSSSPKVITSDTDEFIEIVELSPDHKEPNRDETHVLREHDLPPSSACPDGSNSNDKSRESTPDMLTNIVSSQKGSGFLDSHMLTSNSKDENISNSGVPKNDVKILEDGTKTSHLEVTGVLANIKTASSASQGSNVKTQGLNTKSQGSSLPMKKSSVTSTVPTLFATRSSSIFTNSRIKNPATNVAKPRTWHRSASNPASSVTNSVPRPLKTGTGPGQGQNSYIRNGNTLVRKGGAPVTAVSSVPPPSRSSINHLNPSGPIETRTGGSTIVVRPKTPPLSGGTKLADSTMRDLPSSPLEQEVIPEYHKSSGAPEDQNGTSSNSESQKTVDEGTSTGKKIQYVKRKSNQLVAASSSDQSVQELDKTQASSSDGYYKRRKNQLIRTSVGDDSANRDVRKASKINIKRQFSKGMFKKYKNLRFPSVWTLGSQTSGKDGVSIRQKLRPHLFPWKRSKYWGNVMNISTSVPSNSSSSLISRKLLLSRKRETIYTRSKHGFSLRMSKLLSVGGSSLKWSKSIEKNSKRANEEATLAVAAAEKKKREQHFTARPTTDLKSRNNASRDRIFRIGQVRYKMDPSRRTLQRISDEEPSTSKQSKEEVKGSYIPKRLLIGHDEYLRIGNGNQLVRNPKRRIRIFANEKVRWSLHTARSRLAKKKKYCQFFTRFGKCNKDDGKCPYIHDSSKIAVCTKFLNGLCSNPDCKLTHKVIPERMQDCSYFLQGFCSNEHCPYRHVNVNSTASICEGFLKGYCADGNECKKKHTYACPVFEATGECSQGTKCKLHHPKNLKRKPPQSSTERHQKNTRGRYFGGGVGGEAAMRVVPETRNLKDGFREGEFGEYISLDCGFEEFGGDVGSDQSDRRVMVNCEPLDEVDLDEMIKPIGIMKKRLYLTV